MSHHVGQKTWNLAGISNIAWMAFCLQNTIQQGIKLSQSPSGHSKISPAVGLSVSILLSTTIPVFSLLAYREAKKHQATPSLANLANYY
jgi:hypothetical protein